MSVPTIKILTCLQWDASQSVCTHEAWVEQPSLIPPLSVGEGSAIGFAIFGLWALSWVVRPFIVALLPNQRV